MRTLILVVSLLGLTARADSTSEIWKAKCKSCHGEDGRADTKVGKKEKIRDMRDPAWHADFSDEEIRKVITDGSVDNKKMKPFKDKLSAEEIEGLVKHIRGFRSGVPIVQVGNAPPAPAPAPPPQKAPPPVAIFKWDRAEPSPPANVNPSGPSAAAPPPPPAPPTKPDENVKPAEPHPEDPPVKVMVKVTEPTEQPAEPSSTPNSWLSIAAIALSIVALIIALTRKR